MRLEWRNPRTLQPHPGNPRRHSNHQRTVFADFLNDVGWIAPLILNERTGNLIDGHMRRDEAIERNLDEVPVMVVNLPPEREAEALYFFDRIGELANDDDDLTALLAGQFETDQDSLLALLAGQPVLPDSDDDEEAGPREDLMGVSLVPGEGFNYVVLLFKTDIDWLAAQEHFKIEKVEEPFRVKRTIGIGRIVDGGEYLKRVL